MVALLLQEHGHGGEDILVVVDEGDGRHGAASRLLLVI
jgi:hypothetical protein